jgi:hypothetical protein
MSKEPSAVEKMIGDFAPSWLNLRTACFLAMSGNGRSFQSVIVVS